MTHQYMEIKIKELEKRIEALEQEPKTEQFTEEDTEIKLDTGIKLDEAIERYASNAEFERTHGNLQGCLEFRQLAKWLRELKMYRRYLLDYRFEADAKSEVRDETHCRARERKC